MATFRKRPVAVEIRRADGVEEIETREGTVYADESEGDLVAEGPQGDVYPIGPRILAKTYAPGTDPEAFEIYRECVPDGVRIEFEDVSPEATVASAIWIDADADLSEAEREEAEEFVREFVAASPRLEALEDGEVAYL